jgi:RNA polymerase sigma factor (sigma-70 family)
MIDDRALVHKILEGDIQAFRHLISQHERLVAHMIGRLVRRQEEKEELCQDVFLKVHEKLGEFGFQSKLSTWIATIAYRQAINHLRKRKMLYTELPEEGDFASPFVNEETPEVLVAEKDMDAFIFRLIDGLPAQYKAVLTLYHVEEMSYPEICEVMAMPEGTVKIYLFRARNLLKEHVKKYLGKEELL